MRAEFAKKSNTKRQKIFLKRTESLMIGLVNDIAGRSERSISADERKVIARELTSEVFQVAKDNASNILALGEEPAISHNELVAYLKDQVKKE